MTGLTLLASTPVQTVNPVPGASFDANYTEYVYRDTGGVAGAGLCTGCLDFFIVVTNAGPGIIEHVTTSLSPGFAAFTTDVGVNSSSIAAGGPVAGGIDPLDVDRSSDGAVVDFNYGSNNLLSGQTTASLEIHELRLGNRFSPGRCIRIRPRFCARLCSSRTGNYGSVRTWFDRSGDRTIQDTAKIRLAPGKRVYISFLTSPEMKPGDKRWALSSG